MPPGPAVANARIRHRWTRRCRKRRRAAALRILKICASKVGAIEGYGIPPPHCQSEAGRFLNHVLFMMHREAGLQFPCPAVSWTSNEHYSAHVYTNTIFVPMSEAEFLLHMPNFYHEIGRRGQGLGIKRAHVLPCIQGDPALAGRLHTG